MRTCPNCGHMLSDKDTICFKCGMQLSQIAPKQNMGGMPPGQPMMGMKNPMGGAPKGGPMKGMPSPNSNDEKKKSIIIVSGLIILLVIAAVVILLVSKNNKLDDEDTGTDIVLSHDDEEGKNVEEGEEPVIEEPEEPEQPAEPENPGTTEEPIIEEPSNPNRTECGEPNITEGYHKVENNGYAYAVPDEYSAKDYQTQGFDLLNYKKTKEMLISINRGTVENLKENLPAVKQMYIDSGASVHGIKVTTIAGIEMICVELSKNNQEIIIGITNASEGEIFVIAVYDHSTNTANYDILEEGANIVKSATKTACGGVTSTANA